MLSVFSVFIKPEFVPFMAIIGLFFPILLFLNITFLVLRLWQRKRLFILALIAILTSFFRISDFYAFNSSENEQLSDNIIKVMSYNVRLFDLYQWTGQDDGGNKIFEIINNENADIICIQEFYSSANRNFQDRIIECQQTKDYIISAKGGSGYSGNAIFSKYPVIFSGYVDIGTTTQKCIFADIVRGKDTLRVYSIHLASVGLSRNDYEFLKNLQNNDQKKNLEGVKGIGSKLLQAYVIRSKEVDRIAPHIKESPYKTIVCGDFNDTPVSYSYRRIKGELNDAFIDAGFGIGNTYTKGLPIFRIDYIFHTLQTVSYKRINKDWSDHYPIVAELAY